MKNTHTEKKTKRTSMGDADTIQIVGLTNRPVRLRTSHIHGDRHQLLRDPDHTHVYVRRKQTRSATPGAWGTVRRGLSMHTAPAPTYLDRAVFLWGGISR